MELKIEYIDIEDLKPYLNNAKIHTSIQIEQIKKSIEEFGMNDPIAVWKDNEIVEGHGRLIALKELGYNIVPIVRLDHLTDEQRKAYSLIHNKLTMSTDFDWDVLQSEIDDISNIDMMAYGISEAVIPEPLDSYFDDAGSNEDENHDGEKRIVICPYCGKEVILK